jgi:hypothetical protein
MKISQAASFSALAGLVQKEFDAFQIPLQMPLRFTESV